MAEIVKAIRDGKILDDQICKYLNIEKSASVTLRKSFSASVPVDLIRAEGNSSKNVAVITAEMTDSMGDIVKVDGIAFEHFNASNPMPVFPQHMPGLPDGGPSRVGDADTFRRTTVTYDGQTLPALIMEWEWVDTDVADKWKRLNRSSKGPLKFSIGALVIDADAIKDKEGNITGLLYTKTKLREVSVTDIPANEACMALTKQDNADKEPVSKAKDDCGREPGDPNYGSPCNEGGSSGSGGGGSSGGHGAPSLAPAKEDPMPEDENVAPDNEETGTQEVSSELAEVRDMFVSIMDRMDIFEQRLDEIVSGTSEEPASEPSPAAEPNDSSEEDTSKELASALDLLKQVLNSKKF